MSRLFLCCFLLPFVLGGFPSLASDSDFILIGILGPLKAKSAQVIPEYGTYRLEVEGMLKAEVKKGERITFEIRGTLVQVSLPGKVLGQFKNPRLRSDDPDAFFRIYILNPVRDERVYDGGLRVSVSGGCLKMINKVDLEKYVAGVVEAETGKEKALEFYKVQAIISRTYALNNKRRFLSEGYNLNDQVDCQVYHGKCRWEPDILAAVLITEGKVLVDSEMRLITAAFHSNSGGETVSSESVWSGPLPYLTPKRDEFSLNGEHAEWTKTIARSDWLGYLKSKFALAVHDPAIAEMATNYNQESREIYFPDPSFKIPLKDIRTFWKLNSTFFDIEPKGPDSLVFRGRGFGHGAGLSQEGAMWMAELGFSFTDILHYYYNDVHLIDLHALDFFRNEQ